jgi:hypothetical protein
MAQTIQVKRSTSTDAPTALDNGELAYAHTVAAPGKLYIGRPGGQSGDIDAIGGKYYVDRSETAYGWGDHALAGYAADSSLANYLPLSGGTMTGNITLPDTGQLKLSNTASLYSSGTGTYLSEFGAGNLNFLAKDVHFVSDSGGSDTDYFAKFIYNGGVELYHDGTKKVETTAAGFDIAGNLTLSGTVDGRDVATDGTKLDTIDTSANNYTLADLNTHLAGGVGNIVTSGYIRGPAAMVIDPAAHADATGSLTILGDLVVEGTTTTINSTVVEIADERVVVNKEQTGTPTSALLAGLEVERGDSTNAYLLWREANSGWYVSDGGPSDYEILHANNWGSAYTGVVDGGTF